MIYDKIKALCVKQKISISSVEKKASLSSGSIFKWKVSSPTIDSLIAVAKALGVPLEELIKEEVKTG